MAIATPAGLLRTLRTADIRRRATAKVGRRLRPRSGTARRVGVTRPPGGQLVSTRQQRDRLGANLHRPPVNLDLGVGRQHADDDGADRGLSHLFELAQEAHGLRQRQHVPGIHFQQFLIVRGGVLPVLAFACPQLGPKLERRLERVVKSGFAARRGSICAMSTFRRSKALARSGPCARV